MKQKIVIISEEHRNRAVSIVQALTLDPMHEVIIREHHKDRSADQNALYWKWLTVIGAEMGESKEDLHERYKEMFLINIYCRDNPDYAEMIESLRTVYRGGMKVEAVALRKKVVSLTSTTTATVKQMTEYLECIDHNAASLAIRLPLLED